MAINKKLLHFKKFSDFNSKKLSANEANTQYTLGVGGETHDGAPDVLYQSICWIKDTQQQWTHGQLYDGSTNSVESNVYYTEFTADDVYWTYMTEGSPAPLTITQELLDAINANNVIVVPAGVDRGSYIMQVGALDQETTRVTFIGSIDLIYCDMLNTNFILGNTINLITAGRRCSTMFEPSTTDTEGNTIVKRDSKGSIYAASYKGPTKAWNMPDATNVASDEGQLQAKLVNGTTIKKINNRNILGSGNITVQDTLVSGTNIKTVNGQSILGSGNLNTDNRVVLEFSICDLKDLIAGNISAISIDPQSLETNIILNVPMIIPYSEEEGYRGYYTVTGFMEDLVYLTIVAGASVYYIEHGIGNYDITAQEVHRYAISEMHDLVQNINADLANLYDTKQDLLVSGNNIKTINGQSILGSGDIVITGGNVGAEDDDGTLGEVNTHKYIKYVAQTLTDAEKAQARANIGIDLAKLGSDITVNYPTAYAFDLIQNTMQIWQVDSDGCVISADTWTSGTTAGVLLDCSIEVGSISFAFNNGELLWANDGAPTFEVGYIYEIWFNTYDGGNTWLAAYTKYTKVTQ